LTGAVLHSWETFEDYPSYTFVDKHVLVYDQKSGLYVIKGSSMELVWMPDGTLLHPDDVDEYLEENPEAFVKYHLKDYFIDVAKFDPNLRWMIYRQYSYWIQTEWTKEEYGFPEEVGERIHAEWDPEKETYVPSDKLWLGLQTYLVFPEGVVPSDIHDGSGYEWLIDIYNAFPEEFKGFDYKWLPP